MPGILSRPLDLIFVIYFITHIPPTLLLDFQALYPSDWVPQSIKDLLSLYIQTYRDPLVGSPVTLYWFKSFIICEALFQFPFFIIASIYLIKDNRDCYDTDISPVYGSHVATTVIASLAEVMFNDKYGLTVNEQYVLCGFYIPYLIIPILMVIDSSYRINRLIVNNKIKSN
ncbi:transmembrane protein 6/97 [Pilobolus umbonatus]|nr:transmembrane protein 6/97 [Pilobolus umbonatus]